MRPGACTPASASGQTWWYAFPWWGPWSRSMLPWQRGCCFTRSCANTVVPRLILCYNSDVLLSAWGGSLVKLTPQVVWQMFRTTGSVSAYLLYRQLLAYNKGLLH